MNQRSTIYILMAMLIFQIACTEHTAEKSTGIPNQEQSFEAEKAAILKVINEETKAAFDRDYPAWKAKWIQEEYVTKTYMNFSDTTLSETLGWNEIDDFVRTYIEEHPESVPLPAFQRKIIQ